jgi:hypothetical protein
MRKSYSSRKIADSRHQACTDRSIAWDHTPTLQERHTTTFTLSRQTIRCGAGTWSSYTWIKRLTQRHAEHEDSHLTLHDMTSHDRQTQRQAKERMTHPRNRGSRNCQGTCQTSHQLCDATQLRSPFQRSPVRSTNHVANMRHGDHQPVVSRLIAKHAQNPPRTQLKPTHQHAASPLVDGTSTCDLS